jgi:hypothetical protein
MEVNDSCKRYLSAVPRAVGAMIVSTALQRGEGATNNPPESRKGRRMNIARIS